MMLPAETPFLPTMLAVVLSTFLLVMSTAFLVIPYSIGAHPGEPRLAATQSGQFHPT